MNLKYKQFEAYSNFNICFVIELSGSLDCLLSYGALPVHINYSLVLAILMLHMHEVK